MAWTPIPLVYPGTAGVNALFGRRLFAKRSAELPVFTPEGMAPASGALSVRAGTVCFLGRPVGLDVVVAVPNFPVTATMNIDRLALGTFESVRVNWATLQFNFDIDG